MRRRRITPQPQQTAHAVDAAHSDERWRAKSNSDSCATLHSRTSDTTSLPGQVMRSEAAETSESQRRSERRARSSGRRAIDLSSTTRRSYRLSLEAVIDLDSPLSAPFSLSLARAMSTPAAFVASLTSASGFNPQAYLEKFGYASGKGLGKKEDGRTSHILVNKKEDTKGVSAETQGDSR